jgi:hypothetical protein
VGALAARESQPDFANDDFTSSGKITAAHPPLLMRGPRPNPSGVALGKRGQWLCIFGLTRAMIAPWPQAGSVGQVGGP